MRETTPWRVLLALSATMGVPPAAFWRLSLREWRALTASNHAEHLSRDAFRALATQFPDEGR